MGVMAAPAVKITGLLMAPFYIVLFYTVNTFVFGLGLMDSMLETMLGTPAEMVPEVTKPLMDAMFFGFGVCNVAIAALLYPVSTDKAVLKFQNLVFFLFMLGFLPVLVLFYNEGMMGVTGAGQYAVMNGLAACIGLYNYCKL